MMTHSCLCTQLLMQLLLWWLGFSLHLLCKRLLLVIYTSRVDLVSLQRSLCSAPVSFQIVALAVSWHAVYKR